MKNTQQVNKRKKQKKQIKVQTKENTLKTQNEGALRGDLNPSPIAQSKPRKMTQQNQKKHPA
jgi:hypothetical protein